MLFQSLTEQQLLSLQESKPDTKYAFKKNGSMISRPKSIKQQNKFKRRNAWIMKIKAKSKIVLMAELDSPLQANR